VSGQSEDVRGSVGWIDGLKSEVRSVEVGAAGRKEEVAVARCVYLGAVRDVRVVTNRIGGNNRRILALASRVSVKT
jgi:hypothetical protein